MTIAPRRRAAFRQALLAWHPAAPLPVARQEVAAAALDGQIAVVGGFLDNRSSTALVELYSPRLDRWQRLPDLPVVVNHPMAAAAAGRLYVAGGYGAVRGRTLRAAFVLDGGRWRRLPPLPAPRAAGGAAIVGGRLYVVGGVGASGLAKAMLVLDLAHLRWSTLTGPSPREHLAVTAAGGRIYALGGRTAGYDTNVATLEEYLPGRGWRLLPAVPEPRGGTGAAIAGGLLVSVGGEEPAGTIATVFGFDLALGRWRRLPDLTTPRHGAGVVAVGKRVYAIGGGVRPGFGASAANEFLQLR